jgi:hypothetical protein
MAKETEAERLHRMRRYAGNEEELAQSVDSGYDPEWLKQQGITAEEAEERNKEKLEEMLDPTEAKKLLDR